MESVCLDEINSSTRIKEGMACVRGRFDSSCEAMKETRGSDRDNRERICRSLMETDVFLRGRSVRGRRGSLEDGRKSYVACEDVGREAFPECCGEPEDRRS